MEILTYVLEGELAHKDSLGTGSVIRPGDVQIMSAGTGIQHSEFNNSESEPVHFLQIWMLPDRQNITPRYNQRDFPLAQKQGKLRLVGSKDGREGSVVIHQDLNLYVSVLSAGDSVSCETRQVVLLGFRWQEASQRSMANHCGKAMAYKLTVQNC